MTVDDLADVISDLQAKGLGSSEVSIPSQTGGNMPLEADYLVVEDDELDWEE